MKWTDLGKEHIGILSKFYIKRNYRNYPKRHSQQRISLPNLKVHSLLIWARTTQLLRCSLPVMTFYIQMWRLGRYCDVASKLLFNSGFGHACREQGIPYVQRVASMEDSAGVNIVRCLGLNLSFWNADLQHYNSLHYSYSHGIIFGSHVIFAIMEGL